MLCLPLTYYVLAGSAVAQAAAEGVALDDISDDKEEFSEEEEEEEEEEMANLTTKKAAKKATPKKESTTENFSGKMSCMKVSTHKEFSMNFKCPFIMYQYNEGINQMVKVEMFVLTLTQSYIIPDVVANGMQLKVCIRVANFFVDEDRVIESNDHRVGFNHNTHQAQSFKDVCECIDLHYGMVNEIFGDSAQMVDLSYQCEERVVNGRCKPTKMMMKT
eukprot:scaffold5220_cov188-Amphora_coffeaeformis.AAC.8